MADYKLGINGEVTIDNSQAKKALEDVQDEAKKLSETFNQSSEETSDSLERFTEKTEGLATSLEKTTSSLKDIDTVIDFAKSIDQADLLEVKLQSLGSNLLNVTEDTEPTKVYALIDAIRKVAEEADKLKEKANLPKVSTEDVEEFVATRTEIQRTGEKLDLLKEKYRQLKEEGADSTKLLSVEEQIARTGEKYEKLRLAAIEARKPVEDITEAFRRIEEMSDLAIPKIPTEAVQSYLQTRTEADRLRDSLELLAREWTAATEAGNDKRALSIEGSYARTKQRLDDLIASEEEQARAAEEAANALRDLGSASDEVVRTFQQGSSLQFFTDFTDKFKDSFNLSDAFSRAGKTISKTFSVITNASKRAANELYNFGKSVAESLGSKLTEGIKKVHGLANSFGRILLYRAVRTLIKDIGASFKTGIDNMYQWSLIADGQFASSMDRLASEAQHVKNALGAALAPVINAMVPIVERLAHAFIDLVNGFNQFVAALTGASSWTKALHTPVKYADAASDGFSKATKKAKEYKNTILAFDELNVLNGVYDDDNGGTGASGKEIADYASMFEKAPLSDFWKKWLATDDWTELGRITARRLNKWLKDIDDWILTKARPFAMKWSKRFATFLNGLIDELDWKLLGKTIADGMMVIIDAVNQFFDLFDSYNFGKKLSEGFKSWFRNIQWESIGKYFSNGLNFIIDLADGFFSDFVTDAREFGNDLGTAFNSWVENIHWDSIRSGLSNGLKSIADILWGFLDTSEGGWDQFKTEFSKTIETVFTSPDLGRIISGIGEFVNRLADLIIDVNWEPVGARVADALASIDWWNVLTAVVTSIAEFFSGLIKESFGTEHGRAFLGTVAGVAGLAGAFSLVKTGLGVALNIFVGAIGETLKAQIVAQLGAEGAVGTTLSTTLAGLGTTALASLGWVAGIGAALVEAGIIAYGAFQAIGTGLDYLDAKWAESQSVITLQSALASKGVQASTEQINQYLNGTISVAELTGGKFASFGEMTGATMNNTAESVGQSLSAISEAAETAFSSVGESTYDFSEDVNSAIVGFLESASDGSSESMNEMADGMNEAFNKIAGNMETITKSLSGAFNSMASSISGSMQTMYNSVSTWMARMASNIETQARRIQNAFNNVNSAANGITNTKVAVPAHANGGMVEDGLFLANHGELVGEFSNGKTAVANNDMIIEGIEQGVYNAVASALANGTNQGGSGDVVLMIDSEEIARASIKGQRSIDRRFNPTVRFTG